MSSTPYPSFPQAPLRDFTADRRVLSLAALAIVVGSAGAGAAWALSRLINLVTNLAYLGTLSAAPSNIADNTLGLAAALIPVAGPGHRPDGALRLGEDPRPRYSGSH
jgi:chloride channel protein, CIC family